MTHIHIDLDTPHTLNRFYEGPARDDQPNDEYCHILLKRVADFFSALQIKATFFVITQDLQLSRYTSLLKKMSQDGHEIASHTHTHPYTKNNYSTRLFEEEIRLSCREIKSYFGFSPSGFRSPGYFLNEDIVRILIDEGFKYDSSIFNSALSPLLNLAARLRGATGNVGTLEPLNPEVIIKSGLQEFPIPTFLGLPYYNNLNLYFPRLVRKGIAQIGAHRDLSPYLFHLIEFADYEKDLSYLPKNVLKHPNIMLPLQEKLEFAKNLIENCKRRGPINLTRDCI